MALSVGQGGGSISGPLGSQNEAFQLQQALEQTYGLTPLINATSPDALQAAGMGANQMNRPQGLTGAPLPSVLGGGGLGQNMMGIMAMGQQKPPAMLPPSQPAGVPMNPYLGT
jgi:hypothetical protein